MDYYDVSNELDRISAKIECFSELIGGLAEGETDSRYSGTYWFIYDTAKQYVKEMEELSGKVMEQHMEIQEKQFKQETKKGKKK